MGPLPKQETEQSCEHCCPRQVVFGARRGTSEVQSLSSCWAGHSRSTLIRGRDYRNREVLGSKEHNVSVVEVSGSGSFAKDFSGIPGFVCTKVNTLYLLSLKEEKRRI